jgi:hypothetical protein
MRAKKKQKETAILGVRIKRDKSLNKLSKKDLFPDKTKEANRILSNLKWTV